MAVVLGSALYAVWWLFTRVVSPALVVTGWVAYRWFSGAAMGRRVRVLAGWPRWQRAIARTVVTAVGAATLVRPLWTAAIISAAGAFTALGVLESRRRRPLPASEPVRVTATVARPCRPSLPADPEPAAPSLLSRLRKEITR